ncbi:unnamed protein product [Danaus chrysippus]|uniref:(African queen) hypothetical protein n=1 Tax=Danaus chrysippus TaxID=151541 RepID=A0A8J2MW92_9NEOP|nr:unnamed protein product [Danaus chrysippus]
MFSVGAVFGGGGGSAAASTASAPVPCHGQRLTMGDRCACAPSRAHQGRRQLLVSWTQASNGGPRPYHYHTTNVLN